MDKYSNGCIGIITLTPARSFITLDVTSYTITVRTDETTEPAVYDDFLVTLTLGTNIFTRSVKVTFTDCVITRLAFRPSQLTISYKIG